MAQTSSTMVSLGTKAPGFALPDTVSGKIVSPARHLAGEKALVIMFICNHCPFVKHVNKELVKLANDYIPKGISFIAISSNDVKNYPDDSPEKMKQAAKELGYPFPYLYDESQEVARAYDAACTPDFFIYASDNPILKSIQKATDGISRMDLEKNSFSGYDKDLKLVYRGQLDDSRPSNGIPVTGKDIRAALDNILAGNPVSEIQKPSIGCNIKWKS